MFRQTITSVLIFMGLLAICVYAGSDSSPSHISDKIHVNDFSSIVRHPSLTFEKIQSSSPLTDIPEELSLKPAEKNRSTVGQVHPALGDAFNDTLLLGYEYSDGVFPSLVYWHYSTDNGANWSTCCYHDLAGATYPSLDYRGYDSYMAGTFLPPSAWGGGGTFVFLRFPDPTNPITWSGSYATWIENGFHNMKAPDIAADDGQQSWNWGFISAVISRNFSPYIYDDIPIIFYQINSLGYTYISWFKDYEGCATSAAAIDSPLGRAISVYDRYNSDNDQWELFALRHNFGDWEEDPIHFVKAFASLDMNIDEPDVSAHDGQVLVVGSAYDAGTPGNHDVICWYTFDTTFTDFEGSSVIAQSPDSETHPRISHVGGSEFVCTFTKNETLFASYTCNGGVSWSAPTEVSQFYETAVDEYRNAAIANGGLKTAYEIDESSFNEIAFEYLEPSDSDGDGLSDACDNCPDNINADQSDTDGDNIGDVCDNCPDDINTDQTDSDNDGLGDACDDCPNDPDNDADSDLICDDIDNCLGLANTSQDDADFDGVGDACDNCVNDHNPNQYNNDGDTYGDACDDDDDDDGVLDINDNCQFNYNPLQEDADTDGIGDVCEYMCGDANDDGDKNLIDILYLIDFKYNEGPPPYPVILAGDMNNDGEINLLDILYLIENLYGDPPGPDPVCP